ncbi:glycosyltransferase family 39 protein [Candidatus Woesebacteria bacterium]|nr:glycosyltransferase family 39 protein [Candidatus Woesebacteria bacterium]
MQVTVVFILSFLVRLIHLNQSLWLDEAITARVVQRFSSLQIITQFAPGDFHPPFYYLFIKCWTTLFGYSEIALRIPSVLAALVAGGMVYKTAELIYKQKKVGLDISFFHTFPLLLFGRSPSDSTRRPLKKNIFTQSQASLFAAVLFLCNPLVVYYSQEARMYMFATMFLSVVMYCAVKLTVKKPTFDLMFAFNFFSFLAIITYYGSLFFIIAALIFLLLHKKQTSSLLLSIGTILGLTLLSPLLVRQLANSHLALQTVQNWRSVLGTIDVKNIVLFPLKFATGRVSFEPKWLYFVFGGAWSMVVFGFVVLGAWREKKFALFFIVPLVLGFVASFVTPMLQYFRFQYVILPISILLALGVEELGNVLEMEGSGLKYLSNRSKKITRFVMLFIITIFAAWSALYLFFPQFHREDWNTLSFQLQQKHLSVYILPSKTDPIIYYNPSFPVKNLEQIDQADEAELIIIPYATDIHGFSYRSIISSRYQQIAAYSVRGIVYEEWAIKK